MIPAMQALAVGLALKFIVPIPSGVTEQVSMACIWYPGRSHVAQQESSSCLSEGTEFQEFVTS